MSKRAPSGQSVAKSTVAHAYSKTATSGNGQVPRGSFAAGVAKLSTQAPTGPGKNK